MALAGVAGAPIYVESTICGRIAILTVSIRCEPWTAFNETSPMQRAVSVSFLRASARLSGAL
jgi:hypothetical protein